MNGRPRVRRAAGILLVLAAAAFLGLSIQRNWSQLRDFDWHVSLPALGASVLALVLVLGSGVFVWGRVLHRFPHRPVEFRTLLRIWFVSNLARYIPGKVWQFVSAAELAHRAGLSRTLLLTSLLVHVAFSLLAAVLIAIPTQPLPALGLDADPRILLVAAAVVAAGIVHPAVINGILRLVPRALKRDVLVWEGRWIDGLELLALALFNWAIYGLAFALFVDAVVDVPWSAVPPLAGVNALAFVTGYLAIVAPGGLGAREAALAVLLRPFAPAGVASLLAVVSRLWMVAAELLGALLAVLPKPVPGPATPEAVEAEEE